MKTITDFLGKHGLIIALVLVLISTCTGNMAKKQSEKRMLNQVEKVQKSVDSLNKVLQKQIKVEGLNSELRMIESTDRRMMDKNRQSQIRQELQLLEKQ